MLIEIYVQPALSTATGPKQTTNKKKNQQKNKLCAKRNKAHSTNAYAPHYVTDPIFLK